MPTEHALQPAADAQGDLPRVTAPSASARVRAEWRARIVAEYTSAAITHNLVLWLIQLGAPPDLLDAGLAIVSDELVHSRLSAEVYAAAGGSEPPAIDQGALGLARTTDLVGDVLQVCVRVFCLGETVAVPLFSHLRMGCREPVARAALDRILRDEVRHRDFGWDLLDWLLALDDPSAPPTEPSIDHTPTIATRVADQLPRFLRELDDSYGHANAAVIADETGTISDADRAWGLAPPRDYADILRRTLDHDFRPRFDARGIEMPVGLTAGPV